MCLFCCGSQTEIELIRCQVPPLTMFSVVKNLSHTAMVPMRFPIREKNVNYADGEYSFSALGKRYPTSSLTLFMNEIQLDKLLSSLPRPLPHHSAMFSKSPRSTANGTPVDHRQHLKAHPFRRRITSLKFVCSARVEIFSRWPSPLSHFAPSSAF